MFNFLIFYYKPQPTFLRKLLFSYHDNIISCFLMTIFYIFISQSKAENFYKNVNAQNISNNVKCFFFINKHLLFSWAEYKMSKSK